MIPPGAVFAGGGRFQTERRNQHIAQRQQRFRPSAASGANIRSAACAHRARTVDIDAKGVGELRAGQQRLSVSTLECDLENFHDSANLFASSRKRKTRRAA